MGERELRGWIDRVRDGSLSRRQFTRLMLGLGLTAPMAAQMLASAGLAQAQTKPGFNPTKRGGGGALKLLWWQAPTLLWEVSSKENKWLGRNATRWRNEEYDRLWKAAEAEMDPVKRAAHFIRMNDLLIQNVVVIPVIWRNKVAARSLKLKDTQNSGWDSDLGNLANWYREA